jgi:hypothetical protein
MPRKLAEAEGGGIDPAQHQPPAGQINAVKVLNECADKIRNGGEIDKAVYLCWLFHLVGDIHQPLHCVALFSDQYPNGDKGGNAIRIRISSSPTNLHSFWDGLLGRGMTAGAIGRDLEQIEAVMKEKAETIQPDLDAHKTPESWAKEGAAMAPKVVYLDGELVKARDDGEGVLEAPAEYAPACGRVARVQIGKAGKRLAETLGELLTLLQPAKMTFAIHANEGAIQPLAWSPLKAEFEKRGFSCKIVRSPKTESKTPNQDRAKIMVKALKGVEGDIVLLGVSNEGLFMPLVAAERPIRRIVMINAVVPTPGKSFREAFDFKDVFVSRFGLHRAPPECRRYARSNNSAAPARQ